jgi:hypothetical protein
VVLRKLGIFPLWGVDLGHCVGDFMVFGELGIFSLWEVDSGQCEGAFRWSVGS